LAGDTVLFYAFAAIMVLASLLVVGQRSPIYSVLLLIVSFAALAGLYVLLDAPFLAVVQIIIYAGAIMVLFLFVVMLLNAPHEATGLGVPSAAAAPGAPLKTGGPTATDSVGPPGFSPGARGPRWAGAALALVLLVELAWSLWRAGAQETEAVTGHLVPGTDLTSVRQIGRVLFIDYGFAFEVTSVLILVAMVGAVVLAKREI
jgi:NADH-quinone oxidoreductase subunit J